MVNVVRRPPSDPSGPNSMPVPALKEARLETNSITLRREWPWCNWACPPGHGGIEPQPAGRVAWPHPLGTGSPSTPPLCGGQPRLATRGTLLLVSVDLDAELVEWPIPVIQRPAQQLPGPFPRPAEAPSVTQGQGPLPPASMG